MTHLPPASVFTPGAPAAEDGATVLIVEARYYDEICEMLLAGAERALVAAGAGFDRINVPGALEIPTAIRLAMATGRYDAFVALGCVIKGGTRHDVIVGDESARGLIELGVHFQALIGNGILTVESGEQAKVRADPAGKDKGGDAARAALALLELKRVLSP
jgi:6,7-dimethyl-8-ribityllumazine synthase